MMKKNIIVFSLICSALLSGCAKTVNIPEAEIHSDLQSEVFSIKEDSSSEEEVFESEATLEIVDENPPKEEKKIDDTVSIVMVGDILLHTPVENSAKTSTGNYDFTSIFANVKDEISAADIAIVNQEVMIGGEELGISGYPAFNAPYSIADSLVDTGFDVVCHATNHALDKGAKGINNCMKYWNENYPNIAVLGIHDSQEDQNQIYITENNGIRIAILNYTYGTNGIKLPANMPFAVDLLDETRVKNDLSRAETMADFTIVCPHWGTEYVLDKTAMQDKWTKIFYEGGADLVIGTHPHVIEPMEMISYNGNEMLVYYSLGNFVNWTSGTGAGVANRMVGGMADIELTRDTLGKVVIKRYDIVPLVTHVSDGFGGVTTYLLEDYSEDMASCNMIRKQDGSFSYEYAKKLVNDIWRK